jgi:hypothetical protein
MNRRRLLLGAGALALLGLAGVAVVRLAGPSPRINRESYDQIRPGMTRQQVEHIIGAAPGDYRRAGGRAVYFERPELPDPQATTVGLEEEVWIGEEAAILVGFDARGLAADKQFATMPHGDETFLDRLRRLLPW